MNTFFNETGQAVGVKPAGVSWQLDEPGFVSGNIYTHFANSTAAASALDNSNKVAPGMPNDVSMGLGHSFTLLVGQSATVVFDLTTAAPPSGFYLAQTDPDSNASIFFSSRGVSIFGQATAVPEPGSALVGLFCFGIVTSTLLRRSQLRAPGRCGS